MEESSIKNGSSLPPFLAKCYEIVDDPLTDSIISWNPNDSSFVIWDLILFQRDLLPNYFKHGNFSSFLRQLNTYGFRKSDPDRWEFINDGFIKGQKHLLWNISRRKSSQSLTQQKQLQQNNTSVASCVEVGKFGLWEEVEILKRDKILLKQELVKLRQHQLGADGKLLRLRRRLQGMEINQQQMLSLLAMAMQSPGFLAQLLQQNESNWCIAETSKKRPLCALEQSTDDVEPIASDGQIVRYKPPEKETPKPLLMPMSNMDGSQQLDPCPNDFFMNIDFLSFGEGVSVPMEEDLPSENDGPLILSDLLEDGIMDQLLLSSPFLENTEETEPNTPETLEKEMEMELDSINHDTCVETSQTPGL